MGMKPQSDSQVVYSPPTAEAVDAFARQVCQRLGQEYKPREVIRGLAAFVQIVADITVQDLNRQHGGSLEDITE